ncbi:MAG: hypothetical protein ACOX6U_11295 [Oscillospiraceae bacterium]|jgi:hypothetical protein
MKGRKIARASIMIIFLIGLASLIPFSFYEWKNPDLVPMPEVSYGTVVPLPRLVEHYEETLPSDVPKISVTARRYGEGYAVDYRLPYDGLAAASEEKAEADQNFSWFNDLANNYYSLPQLDDRCVYDTENKKRASEITIAFEKQPDGVVTIIDHKVSWWMLARDMNGVTEGSRRIAEKELQKNHTHIFGTDGNVLTFELWEYFELHAMSDPPILRGLQIQCAFDGVPVEYYILLYYDSAYIEVYYPEVAAYLHPLEE